MKNIFFVVLMGAVMSSFSGEINKNKKPKVLASQLIIPDEQLPGLKKKGLAGSGEAAFRLWEYFSMVKLENKEASYWLLIGAENGHAIAQLNYAYELAEKKNEIDRERARFWARRAAENGLAEDAKIFFKEYP